MCNSITKLFQNGELSTSQKQTVIKLIEKKNKDKKLIKNCTPVSLLNVDTKLIFEVSDERLKKVLPSLISKNQGAKNQIPREDSLVIEVSWSLILLKSLII